MINKQELDNIRKSNYINKYSTLNNSIKNIIHNNTQLCISITNYQFSIFNQLSSINAFINVINSSNRLIYATKSSGEAIGNETSIKSTLYNEKTNDKCTKIHSTFPQCDTVIFIPKKVRRYLDKNVRLDEFREIDRDVAAAKEKLLIVVSLISTQLINDKRYWKRISHTIIQTLVRKGNDNTNLSGRAVRLLERHGIIEIKKKNDGSDDYEENKYVRSFRLSLEYFKQPVVEYHLKNRDAIENRQIAAKLFDNDFKKSSNPIIKNLLHVYQSITLPTVDEIHERAKLLIENGYSKRGKKLIYLGKKKRNTDLFIYVEEHIEIFNYLVKSIRTPTISSDTAGGRVTDFLNLMPSWIRQLVRMDGEAIVECDYKCLHPNLAVKIFGGTTKFLTHEKIADDLNIDVLSVKQEHLSFFNCHENQMVKSLIHDYYLKNESKMLARIKHDKKVASPWYKRTSKKLFGLEVQLMTEVITRLNQKGIYVIYVYDALYAKESEANEVKEVMNEVAEEMGIYTTVG